METNKVTLAVAIVALALSLGIPVADRTFGDVLENELQYYYICDIDQSIMEFKGGISGTGYTGYPYAESRKGYVRCGTTDNKGEWILLNEYALELGVDPYELIEQSKEVEPQIPEPVSGEKKWLCGIGGCVPHG